MVSRFLLTGFSILAVALTPFSGAIAEGPGERYGDWWRTVQRDIADSEYRASEQRRDNHGETLPSGSYHFANRKQNLRAYLTGDGAWRMAPREVKEGTSSWNWEYRLEALGRGEAKESVREKPKVSLNGKRIEISRSGGVTEWYSNSPLGIEQGFDIAKKPVEGGSGLLTIRGVVKTNLHVSSMSDEQVTFSTESGDAFRLSELKAFDSRGLRLPIRIAYDRTASELTLYVDDADARYPIVVDPLSSSPAVTFEANQADAEFGVSVATAGDVRANYSTDSGEATAQHAASVSSGEKSGAQVAGWRLDLFVEIARDLFT